jgi:hypothetical protein
LPQGWPQRRRLFLPIMVSATFPVESMRPGRARTSVSDRRFREGAQTVRRDSRGPI